MASVYMFNTQKSIIYFLSVVVCFRENFEKTPTFYFQNDWSLLGEGSHGKTRRRGKREILSAPDAFSITHALAYSLNRECVFYVKQNGF